MNKRGIEASTLVKWIIGLTFLAIAIGIILILRARGLSLIDLVKPWKWAIWR